jgi:hypothetical protein
MAMTTCEGEDVRGHILANAELIGTYQKGDR